MLAKEDDRAAKAAQKLMVMLREGAPLSLDLADQLRELLPKRKRGGQPGSSRPRSVKAQGDAAAGIYAFETEAGATSAKALDDVREQLGIDAADSTLHEAMRPHIDKHRQLVGDLFASAKGLQSSRNESEVAHAKITSMVHTRVSSLPARTHEPLYAALDAWSAHTRAVAAHASLRTGASRRALAAAREEMNRALAVVLAALARSPD